MKSVPHYWKMANGWHSIVLQEGVDYHSFPKIAEKWAKRLSLNVSEKVDGPDVRIWGCSRDGCSFWLAHDDWFPEISLEPRNSESAARIFDIGSEMGIDPEDEPSSAGD